MAGNAVTPSVSQMRRAIGAKLPPIPRAPSPLQIWKEEWDCKIAEGRIGRSCCRRVLLIVDHQIAEELKVAGLGKRYVMLQFSAVELDDTLMIKGDPHWHRREESLRST